MKGDILMEKINRSIECTVEDCRHHCSTCGYCSLDKIRVGSHMTLLQGERSTDCCSFDAK